ncbi:hypothetical protein HPB51_027461 [Rhipicephalus microplus]|uniref:Uncharacterized protein n=1 Tax=Rhipicephalus microplus TaxID=6941 RepID=A0A9J6D066_RHIMP|nr:hypothetical protein HPB51_027461 [Rhipicephalus microplus]
MSSVSASVAADEEHSLPSRSTDHIMDTQTSQDANTQASNEHNAQPWITITKRANKTPTAATLYRTDLTAAQPTPPRFPVPAGLSVVTWEAAVVGTMVVAPLK